MKNLMMMLAACLFAFAAHGAELDPTKSEFKWTGTKVTGKHFGTLPLKSSNVKMAKGKITGGEFVLDITNLTVTDLTGDYAKKFINHMKSKDFFEVAKWPTAKLVVKSVKNGMAKGELTVKDKTNPVSFKFTEKKGVYTGQLKFDRTKFNMIYGSGDFFKGLGDKMIHNDVTLDFSVQMKKSSKKMAQN